MINSVKALYLRGKSYLAIREYEQALNDFKTARDLKLQCIEMSTANMNSNPTFGSATVGVN